jgi:predicted PurR-regulated permease PerM
VSEPRPRTSDEPSAEAGPERWERTRARAVRVWMWVGIGILAYGALSLIARIADVLMPFVLAGFLVLFLEPSIAWLVRHRVPRVPAVVITYLLGIAIIVAVLAFLIPPLVAQLEGILRTLPGSWNGFVTWLQGAQGAIARMPAGQQVIKWIAGVPALLQQAGAAGLGVVVQATVIARSLLVVVFSAFMALIIAFYILTDLPSVKREMVDLLPKDHQPEFIVVANRVAAVITGYLRGEITLAVIVAVLDFVVFTILGLFGLGLPYSLAISLLAGALTVIPYLGPWTAAFIAALVGLFVSPLMGLIGFVVVMGVEQFEATFIGPSLVGSAVELHPVLILFALAVGGSLFGILGIALAIPVAAVAKSVFMYFYEKYVLLPRETVDVAAAAGTDR